MSEIISEFVSITGQDADTATAFLEEHGWDLEAAVGAFLGETGEGSQRAPIPAKEDCVLEKEDFEALSRGSGGRGRGRPKSGFQVGSGTARSVFDAFRNFRDESAAVASESARDGVCSIKKVHELSTKFRPPLDLIVRGTLDDVKSAAARDGKQFILANIQDIQEFASHVLNRDAWSDRRVKDVVSRHFSMWQIGRDSDEGLRFVRIYSVARFPFVAALDAISGECLLRLEIPKVGERNIADAILEQLQKFVSEHAAKETTAEKVIPKKTVADCSEEEQLAIAINASLSQKKDPMARQRPSSPSSSSSDGEFASSSSSSSSDSEEKLSKSPEAKRPKPGPETAKTPDTRECVLQIRLTNGSSIIGTFRPSDSLHAVRSFIASNRTDGKTPFEMFTIFPRRKLEGDQSLEALGLAPRSVVVLEKLAS